MSQRGLRRMEVLSRVKAGELKLGDAAELLRVGYRQGERVWKRYRARGAEGLQHGSAGRRSNRAKPRKFREKVLRLVREKYGGKEGGRFGPIPQGGSRASATRRWMGSGSRETAAVDAGRRAVEPGAEAETAPE